MRSTPGGGEEDPTRTPRNDLTQLSCGAQLDLTTLRLPQSSATLAAQDGRFVTLFDALLAANFRSRFTKYIVYFDGRVEDPDICGQGASSSSGIGWQSCTSRPAQASRRLPWLRTSSCTLGGRIAQRAAQLPRTERGHSCESPADLMYPFLDGSPLDAKILDPGRDDYYGHAGSFSDSQDAPWLVQLDRQQPLAVTISGPGGVTADVPGLDCTQSCTTTWNAATRLARRRFLVVARSFRPLGRRVSRGLDVRGRRRSRRDGVGGLRAFGLQLPRPSPDAAPCAARRRNHL